MQDALAHGAVVLTGGRRLQGEGLDSPHYYYYAPTVLGDANRDMALFREETFGPVAPRFRFDSDADVLREANDTPFGLAAYFYSNDVQRIWRVAGRLESGVIGINDDYQHIKYLCQGGLA